MAAPPATCGAATSNAARGTSVHTRRAAQYAAPAAIPMCRPEIAMRWAMPVTRNVRQRRSETPLRSPTASARISPSLPYPSSAERIDRARPARTASTRASDNAGAEPMRRAVLT